MAKKKNENSLTYLQMPLPSGRKYAKMTKVAFGGLNKRYTLDSGELSMESNISTMDYPCLIPSEQRMPLMIEDELYQKEYPISMTAFDDFLIVVYYEDEKIMVDYIASDGEVHTGILESDNDKVQANIDTPRSIVQFNVYDTPTDPLTGKFVKKLLFFPDCASMFMRIEKKGENFNMDTADTDVMYWNYNNAGKKVFSVIKIVSKTGEDGKVTYSREEETISAIGEDGFPISNCFLCSAMKVDIKEYTNDKPEVDESGAIIYPPPDTASHNGWYRNSQNSDIYHWCEYATVKREDDWGIRKNDDGDDEVYGFVLENGCYVEDGGKTYGWKVSIPPTMPSLKHATVHLSRVFGVDDDRVYASGYNDYTNWNLDTIDEYNESNSWCSPSQSNTKAGGKFTGITTYQGHVICFKRDFMHEIYNTKNPFRIQDIYAEGSVDQRTIQDVDGKLIFVSEDDVKIYTGSNPRIIGYNLNMPKYTYAVSGTDNRNYYLYCEDSEDENTTNRYLYVYDTYAEKWSEHSTDSRVYDKETNTWTDEDAPFKVLNFAHNKNGMYMFTDEGMIYKMDTGVYDHAWSFETDLITNQTVDIKHVKKLQMLVDVAENADMQVYILYDHEVFSEMTPEEKAKHLVYASKKAGRYPIRVKPRQTAHYGFKLHFEGKGYVKLYELEIFTESGGDLFV